MFFILNSSFEKILPDLEPGLSREQVLHFAGKAFDSQSYLISDHFKNLLFIIQRTS
jgi:hypothetical protein